MEILSEYSRSVVKVMMIFFSAYFGARWFNNSSIKNDIYYYYIALIAGHIIAHL